MDDTKFLRLAYYIFVGDIGYSMNFMHLPTLSTNMLKLPLPSSHTLWQARTASEWEDEMKRISSKERGINPLTLQSSMALLLGNSDPSSKLGCALDIDERILNPIALNILIHCIASVALEHNHAVPSASSNAINLLRSSDLKTGLACWRNHFERMDPESRAGDIAVSALISYHIVSILLQEDLWAIMVVFDANCVEGSHVSSHTALQERPGATQMRKEACIHALHIIRLCLEKEIATTVTRPLCWHYAAFLASLVVMSYASSLKQTPIRELQSYAVTLKGTSSDVSALINLLKRDC